MNIKKSFTEIINRVNSFHAVEAGEAALKFAQNRIKFDLENLRTFIDSNVYARNILTNIGYDWGEEADATFRSDGTKVVFTLSEHQYEMYLATRDIYMPIHSTKSYVIGNLYMDYNDLHVGAIEMFNRSEWEEIQQKANQVLDKLNVAGYDKLAFFHDSSDKIFKVSKAPFHESSIFHNIYLSDDGVNDIIIGRTDLNSLYNLNYTKWHQVEIEDLNASWPEILEKANNLLKRGAKQIPAPESKFVITNNEVCFEVDSVSYVKNIYTNSIWKAINHNNKKAREWISPDEFNKMSNKEEIERVSKELIGKKEVVKTEVENKSDLIGTSKGAFDKFFVDKEKYNYFTHNEKQYRVDKNRIVINRFNNTPDIKHEIFMWSELNSTIGFGADSNHWKWIGNTTAPSSMLNISTEEWVVIKNKALQSIAKSNEEALASENVDTIQAEFNKNKEDYIYYKAKNYYKNADYRIHKNNFTIYEWNPYSKNWSWSGNPANSNSTLSNDAINGGIDALRRAIKAGENLKLPEGFLLDETLAFLSEKDKSDYIMFESVVGTNGSNSYRIHRDFHSISVWCKSDRKWDWLGYPPNAGYYGGNSVAGGIAVAAEEALKKAKESGMIGVRLIGEKKEYTPANNWNNWQGHNNWQSGHNSHHYSYHEDKEAEIDCETAIGTVENEVESNEVDIGKLTSDKFKEKNKNHLGYFSQKDLDKIKESKKSHYPSNKKFEDRLSDYDDSYGGMSPFGSTFRDESRPNADNNTVNNSNTSSSVSDNETIVYAITPLEGYGDTIKPGDKVKVFIKRELSPTANNVTEEFGGRVLKVRGYTKTYDMSSNGMPKCVGRIDLEGSDGVLIKTNYSGLKWTLCFTVVKEPNETNETN
jgi:hypothetical protein